MNKKLLNTLADLLSVNKNVVFAYLFGSMAKNNERYGSDMDIAVYFNIEPDLSEIGKLNLNLEEKLNYKIDLVQLNRLDKKNPVLAHSIFTDGILLINNNITLHNEFKKSALLHYLDFKPVDDLINRSFKLRLANNSFAVFEK